MDTERAQRPLSRMSLLAEKLKQSSLNDGEAEDAEEEDDLTDSRLSCMISKPEDKTVRFDCVDESTMVFLSESDGLESSLDGVRMKQNIGYPIPAPSEGLPSASRRSVGSCEPDHVTTSPPHLPPKRHCRSLSMSECMARPIAMRPDQFGPDSCETSGTGTGGGGVALTSAGGKWYSTRGHCCHHHHCHHVPHHQHYHHRLFRASPSGSVRPLLSPYARSSAFTPTRPLISPQASSDYSLSPEVDSPVQRPASVSSGYHESSVQSLLEYCSLHDCSQACRGVPSGPPLLMSNPPGAASTATQGNTTISALPPAPPQARCRSQPSFEVQCSQCFCCSATVGVQSIRHHLKRRHDATRPLPSVDGLPGTLQTSQGEQCVAGANSECADVYFFGSSRPYLVSLPRIASSPSPPQRQQGGRPTQSRPAAQSANQQQGHGGRGSQASTLTASSTGTPTNSASRELLSGFLALTGSGGSVATSEMDTTGLSDTDEANLDTGELESSMHEYDDTGHQVELYDSGGRSSLDTDEGESASSTSNDATSPTQTHRRRRRCRDPSDPPDIVGGAPLSSSSGSGTGFCFRPLPDHLRPHQEPLFQELDLDQIEND